MEAAEALLVRSFGPGFRDLAVPVGGATTPGRDTGGGLDLPGPFAALFRHLLPSPGSTPPATPRFSVTGGSLGFGTAASLGSAGSVDGPGRGPGVHHVARSPDGVARGAGAAGAAEVRACATGCATGCVSLLGSTLKDPDRLSHGQETHS